ncbi:7128_t:CDS:2, partial [Gigaspora margarita]
FKKLEIDKKIISKANIRGKVKNIIYFSTDDKKNYAIVINKVARLYSIRLINYEGEDEVKILAVSDLVGFYQTKEEANSKAKEIITGQDVSQCKYQIETQEDDTENIFITGRTGSGKSTLANVICDTNEFEKSESSVSMTKNFKVKVFEWKGVKYRVFDTVRIADTKLSPNQVLFRLAEAIYVMKGGIKQVFVTVDRKFTKEEIEAFKILKAIFRNSIIQYTTIVKKTLRQENKLSSLINSCNGIIYVDNLLLNKKKIEFAEKNRKEARKKLLEHLESCKENYKLKYWDKI